MAATDTARLSPEQEDGEPLGLFLEEPSQSVSHRRTERRARLIAVLVLLFFGAGLGLAAWPGRMSADTLAQIEQVQAGEYTDWHAGLLLVLWRPFWLLGAGPGFVTTAAIVTFLLGLYGVLRVRFGRPSAVIATIVITLLPPVLGWVIYLGRDMWFTAFFLVGCAALVRTVGSEGRWRRVATVGVVAAMWLMLAARQNAMPVCAVLLFAVFWMTAAPNSLRTGVRGATVSLLKAGSLAVLTLLVILGSQALMRRAFDVRVTHIEQSIYIYDLAAISVEEDQVLFDPDAFPAQDLAVLETHFNPASFEPMVFGPNAIIPYPLSGDAVSKLRDDWLDAVVSHPRSYLEARATLWLEQVSITEPSVWIVHPGIDDNSWGYTAKFARVDDAIQRYLRVFASNDQLAGGVVHTVWVYLLVLVGGLSYLRSGSAVRRALAWMCLAGLTYQASLFFALMGTGYRFNVPCVVLAVAVGLIAVADGVEALRRRRRTRQPEPPVPPIVQPGDTKEVETDGRAQHLESPTKPNARLVP